MSLSDERGRSTRFRGRGGDGSAPWYTTSDAWLGRRRHAESVPLDEFYLRGPVLLLLRALSRIQWPSITTASQLPSNRTDGIACD